MKKYLMFYCNIQIFIAQSKLNNIADIISQRMQDGDIQSIELHKVLWEVEKYSKRKVMNAKKQRKELLERRKEGKEDFYEELQAV